MKTKSEIVRFLFRLNTAALYITAGISAYSFAMNQAILNWLILMSWITVAFSGAIAYGHTKGLFNRYKINQSIIRTPGHVQVYDQIRVVNRKMNILWAMAFGMGATGFILAAKYRQVAIGLILCCAAVMLALWCWQLSKELRTLVLSISVPVTEPDQSKLAPSSKRRFYLHFTCLISTSLGATFLLGACAYLIFSGVRTKGIFMLTIIGGAGLAALPYLSGLVVRRLGLPEEVEE